MKFVYVSHPYSGDEKRNVKSARAYCCRLQEAHPDWCLFNPLDNFKFARKSGQSYENYLKMDVEVLGRCDMVVFCGYWKKSNGCRKEYEAAKAFGVKIIELV